jgi:hypothetical protein
MNIYPSFSDCSNLIYKHEESVIKQVLQGHLCEHLIYHLDKDNSKAKEIREMFDKLSKTLVKLDQLESQPLKQKIVQYRLEQLQQKLEGIEKKLLR